MSTASLQEVFIGSYLGNFRIKQVLWHDTLIYREKTILFLCLIGSVFLLFFVIFLIDSLQPYYQLWKWIFSVIILLIFFVAFYTLINDYLDVLVITDTWLIHFQWNNPLVQTTTVIQWVAIESIQQHRSWLWQTLWWLGTIRIQVEEEQYNFHRIQSPLRSIQQLLYRKGIFTKHQGAENVLPEKPASPDSYNVLIEALGEVMEEYMKKKQL